MSENLVMKIDAIEGESETAGYEKWIDCLQASYNFYNPQTASSGGGQSGGALEATPLHVTTISGAHFPALVTKQANGKHWEKITLKFLKTGLGNKLEPFRVIEMTNCFISQYQPAGGAQAGGTENMEISYEEISDEYLRQKPDGSFESKGKIIYNNKQKQVKS
jgi:type VI protein secretion system component Hcp